MSHTSFPNLHEHFRQVTEKSIFFGHQSVGDNLLQGLKELANQYNLSPLPITEYKDGMDIRRRHLYHAKIGCNTSPMSKIEDFVAKVENELKDHIDVACFKFCYVDIVSNTDISMIFDNYRSAMKRVKENCSHTNFVHITVPLTVIQTDIVSRLRRQMGRRDRSIDDNLARNHFNDLIRSEYNKVEAVFDLAALESSSPGKQHLSYNCGQHQISYLNPQYSYDGGHLNPLGRRWIAAEFAKFLASVS